MASLYPHKTINHHLTGDQRHLIHPLSTRIKISSVSNRLYSTTIQGVGGNHLDELRGAGLLGKWEGPASTLPISITPLVLAWLDDHILSSPQSGGGGCRDGTAARMLGEQGGLAVAGDGRELWKGESVCV